MSDKGYPENLEAAVDEANATTLRVKWQRLMGMDDDEISEHLKYDPPCDYEQELAEYEAMCRIREESA